MDETVVEHALVFYQQHLESLKEQEENELPKKGKCPATAEDTSAESGFDIQIKTVAALLESLAENVEHSPKRTETPTYTNNSPQVPPKPKILDASDIEPYINPFTGQWIIPVTPFSPGPSNSLVTCPDSFAAGVEKSRAIINESHSQRRTPGTASTGQLQREIEPSDVQKNAKTPSEVSPRQLQGQSTDWTRFPHLNRTMPPATLGNSLVRATGPVMGSSEPQAHTNRFFREKNLSGRSLFGSRNKNKSVVLNCETSKLTSRNMAPAAAVTAASSAMSTSRSSQQAVNRRISRLSKPQADPKIDSRPMDPWRLTVALKDPWDETQPTSTKATNASPAISRNEGASRSLSIIPSPQPKKSVIHGGSETNHLHNSSKQSPETGEAPTTPPAAQGNLKSAKTAVSPVSWEHCVEKTQGKLPQPVAVEHTHADVGMSLKLAQDLSAGIPQDYESLYQAESELHQPAQRVDSWETQDFSEISFEDYLCTMHSSNIDRRENSFSKLPELETIDQFESDRAFALALANGVPQDTDTLGRSEAESLLKIREEADLAREVAERDDATAIEAELQVIRRMQDEWNASEMQQLADQREFARLMEQEWNDIESRKLAMEQESVWRLQEDLNAEDLRQIEEDQNAIRMMEEHWNASESQDIANGVGAARRLQEEWNRSENEQSAAALAAAHQLQEQWNTSDVREVALERQVLNQLQEQWNNSDSQQQVADVEAPCRSEQQLAEDAENTLGRPSKVSSTVVAASNDVGAAWKPPQRTIQSGRPARQAQVPNSFSRLQPPVKSADDEDLAKAIAERRQRHSKWEAEAQKSAAEAKAAADEIRRLEREQAERTERARQEAERARREEEIRQDAAERERKAREVECVSCSESADRSHMVILGCKHAYCGDCITLGFQSALKGKKPFVCCRSRIPVDSASAVRFLPGDLVTSYQSWLQEIDTPNPMYCAHPSCSAFIPPSNVHGNRASCGRCTLVTCRLCKRAEHAGVCAEDADGKKLLNLAKQQKWTECAKCKNIIEKIDGCLHMTCGCSYEFCYSCGKPWKSCRSTCGRT